MALIKINKTSSLKDIDNRIKNIPIEINNQKKRLSEILNSKECSSTETEKLSSLINKVNTIGEPVLLKDISFPENKSNNSLEDIGINMNNILSDINIQKELLKNILVGKGIQASETERLSSLIEKVNDIEIKNPDPPIENDKIYGVQINESNSNPFSSIIYTDDCTGYINAEGRNLNSWKDVFPFNQIKPCGLKEGKVIGYLQENNYGLYEDGSTVDDTVDIMVEFPKFYWSLSREGQNLNIRISNKKVDDSYVCPAFMYKGKECEHTYIATYYGSESNGRLRSLPNRTPHTRKGKIDLRNLSCANGIGYEQMTPYKLTMLQILNIFLYKSLDSQRNVGVGANYASTKGNTGATATSGFITGDPNGFGHIKFLGIENLWGNGTTCLDGIDIVNKELRINQSGHPNDNTYLVCAKYDNMNPYNPEIVGYMSKAWGSNLAGLFPMELNGSDSTYYGDDCYLTTDVSDYTIYFGGDSVGGSIYKNGLYYLQQFTDPKYGGSGKLYMGRLTYTG